QFHQPGIELSCQHFRQERSSTCAGRLPGRKIRDSNQPQVLKVGLFPGNGRAVPSRVRLFDWTFVPTEVAMPFTSARLPAASAAAFRAAAAAAPPKIPAAKAHKPKTPAVQHAAPPQRSPSPPQVQRPTQHDTPTRQVITQQPTPQARIK